MSLEDLANIATILSVPISITSLFIGGQALYKVNKTIQIINTNNGIKEQNINKNNNQITKTKINNSTVNQTVNKE